MQKFNLAQRILIAIGGTAAMVGGYMNSWWADNSTIAKPRRKKGPGYGDILRSHFDKQRKETKHAQAKG